MLDNTRPGTLVHDVLAGAPVITRPGDPTGGLYEFDCSDAQCGELRKIAERYCPEAVSEIDAAIRRAAEG